MISEEKMKTVVVLDLHSVFQNLPPKQLNLLMSNVNDQKMLRASLEMLQTQRTDITDRLVEEAVGKPQDTRLVLDHILGVTEGTRSIQTSPYPPTSDYMYGMKLIQKQLGLFDSLQTALYGVPLEELGYIENALESGKGIEVMAILLRVKKNFPKLTGDLIHSAASDLMTLRSVVDNLKKKQLSVGTEQKPLPRLKGADGEDLSTENAKGSDKDTKPASQQVNTPTKGEGN